MEYLPDWEMSKKRFAAWWQNETLDRPLVRLSCRREKLRRPLRPLPELAVEDPAYHLDPQLAVDAMENELARTEYFGDCPPQHSRGVNTGYLGSFAGAELTFRCPAVWLEPTVEDWRDAPAPKFDAELPLFKKLLAVSDALAQNANGRYLLEIPDHLDAVTTMSQVQGVERMCLQLLDDPEPVYAYRDALVRVWCESYDFWRAYDREKGFEGTTSWASTFAVERSGVLQCDFSAMIAPAMFRDLVTPELAAEGAHLDAAMFHWDGPGQIPHAQILFEMPEITAIQWVPGAGNPTAAQEPAPLQRAQAAGKPVQLWCNVDELDIITEALNPEGVMLLVDLGPHEDEPGQVEICKAAMKKIEHWI